MALAVFGYMWFTIISSISGAIAIMSSMIIASADVGSYFSMIMPSTLSIVGTTTIQVVLLYYM